MVEGGGEGAREGCAPGVDGLDGKWVSDALAKLLMGGGR